MNQTTLPHSASRAAADSIRPCAATLRGNWRTTRRRDLFGIRFGRLKALSPSFSSRGEAGWKCQCDCGNTATVTTYALTSGTTKSCGCLKAEVLVSHRRDGLKHGWKGSKTYKCWSSMNERCRQRSRHDWMHYGGRGIAVCERWKKFENFLADMGSIPERMSLDRIDVNGNYDPKNCRWADKFQQARNKTDSHPVTAFGESKLAIEWLADRRCAVTKAALYKRLSAGWDPERAIAHPMKPDCRRRSIA